MPTASEIYNRAKGTDSKIAQDQAQLLADQAEGTVEHQELYDVVAAYPGPVVEVDPDQVHAMILVNDPANPGKTITTAAFVSTAAPPPAPGTAPPQQPGTAPPSPQQPGTAPAAPPDTGTMPPSPPDTGTMPAAGGPNPPGQYAFQRGTPPRPPTQPPPAQGP